MVLLYAASNVFRVYLLLVQDTFDDTGRRVRKARVKAADKIAAHAEWVTNNPYRMPQPGQQLEFDGDGAATADDDTAELNGAQQPSGMTGGGSAGPSTSGAAAGRSTGSAAEDEEAPLFSDGVYPCPVWTLNTSGNASVVRKIAA